VGGSRIGEIEAMGETDKKGCGCCGGGILGSIGAVLGALLSWSVNHSILWALIHAFFSWFYVIYHWIKYGNTLT
jgi:hypothetical protein